MKSLAVCSQKGGVGKTTLALNLAYALARRGLRMLLVDVDPQGSIGLSLSQRVAKAQGVAQILENTATITEAIYPTNLPELRLLPAGQNAPALFHQHAEAIEDGSFFSALNGLLADSDADVVLYDTPSGLIGPSLGILDQVDDIVIPIQAEPLAVRTLPVMLEALERLAEKGRTASVAAVVLTMSDPAVPECAQIADELAQVLAEDLLIPNPVPRDHAIVRASAQGLPVGMLAQGQSPAAAAFDLLAEELQQRLGLTLEKTDDQIVRLVD